MAEDHVYTPGSQRCYRALRLGRIVYDGVAISPDLLGLDPIRDLQREEPRFGASLKKTDMSS